MAKSPDAFRTISEVADWLGVQAHVLRFWESKFTQVKPIKRAGGRRYYRPADMLLLGGIKQLLHDDGLTIKGVQKILREEGMSHVSALSPLLDEDTQGAIEPATEAPLPVSEPEEEKGVVLSFEHPAAEEAPQDNVQPEDIADAAPAPVETAAVDEPDVKETAEPAADTPALDAAEEAPTPAEDHAEPEATADEVSDTVVAETADPVDEIPHASPESNSEAQTEQAQAEVDQAAPEDLAEPANALPAFLRRPLAEPDDSASQEPEAAPEPFEQTPEPAPEPAAAEPDSVDAAPEPAPEPEPVLKPRVITIPAFTPEADFPAAPAALTAAYSAQALSAAQGDAVAPLLEKLTALRDSMAARRRNAPTSPAHD